MQTSQPKNAQTSSHKNSTSQSKLLEIERKFNVPVENLFQAFTDSEDLKAWWWPHGLYADHVEIDPRKGGKYFINMKGSSEVGGGGMVGQIEKIVDNECIVMTDNFSNDEGNIISAKEAKMPGEWPQQGYITFEFTAIDDNTSGFKLFQEGIPNDMHKDCIQGWTESFDKLQALLEGHKH